MAEDHSNAELWGKVENLENNFTNLSSQVGRGFESLDKLIRDGAEKTDRRISDLAKDTNNRFEASASAYATTSSQRGQYVLTVVLILIGTLISLGSLGIAAAGFSVGAYTVLKAPIEQTQAVQQKQIDGLDARFAGYVPKAQIENDVKTFTDVTARNSSRIEALEQKAAVSVTDRDGIKRDVLRLDGDVHAVRDNNVTVDAMKTAVATLDNRINSLVSGTNELRKIIADNNFIGIKELSSELNSLRDNFITRPPTVFATPRAAPPTDK